MSTLNDPAFDFDAFFDNISSLTGEETEQEHKKHDEREKWKTLRKKIIKVHIAVSKINKIRNELAVKEKELSILRNDNKDLLEKYIPLEKKYSDKTSEFLKLKIAYEQSETQLKALRCHSNQLQALVKDLESKNEAISIEKSLLSNGQQNNQTNKKHLKHIILFGKLAASQSKLNRSHSKILNKYLREVGENEGDSDKDIDNMEMPPSCSSVDTGIGSSLSQSDDEKIWSPNSLFPNPSSHNNLCTNVTQTSKAIIIDTDAAAIEQYNDTKSNESCHHNIENNLPENTKRTKCSEKITTVSIFENALMNIKTNTKQNSPNKDSHSTIPTTVSILENALMNIKTNTKQNSPNKDSISTNPTTVSILENALINIKTNTKQNSPNKDSDSTNPKTIKKKMDATIPCKSVEMQQEKKGTASSPIKKACKPQKEKKIQNSNIAIVEKINKSDENSTDSEVENIMKTIALSKDLILTPIPPTPVIVQRALKKISLQSFSNKKRTIKKTKFSISEKIRNLELTNFKLNKVICRQRRQLLSANRLILKSRRKSLDSTEDEFVRLLSLMSKVSSRFNIEEKLPKESSSNKDSVSYGINLFKKICSKVDNNVENVRESNATRQKKNNKHQSINKPDPLKRITEVDMFVSKNNTNNHEDNMELIIQDKEISSADCVSQCSNSIDGGSPHEIVSARSSTPCDEGHEENKITKLRKPRRSKLSKLDKLKSKLKRKSKIIVDNTAPPSKRKCKNVDAVCSISLPTEYNNNNSSTSIQLKNKIAYENAVAVMSRLNSQNSVNNSYVEAHEPRLTRSSLKANKNLSSNSLQSSGSENNSLQQVVTQSPPKGNTDIQVCVQKLPLNIIEQGASIFTFPHKKKELYLNNELADEGADMRVLRSRTRKSLSHSPDRSTDNVKKLRSSDNPSNNTEYTKLVAKTHQIKDLDAVDKPSENSMLQLRSTDQLDYNDLSIFENEPEITSSVHQSVSKPVKPIELNNITSTRSIQYIGKLNDCIDSDTSVGKREFGKSRDNPAGDIQHIGQSLPISYKSKKLLNKSSEIDSVPRNTLLLKDSLKSSPDIEKVDRSKLIDSACDKAAVKLANEGTKIQNFFKSMLSKYGIKTSRSVITSTIPEHVTSEICAQMENCLGDIIDVMPTEVELDALVARLETRNYKFFLTALMDFLTSNNRCTDILCKTYTPPLPPMTKTEQALLYVLSALQKKWDSIDIYNETMKFIEFKLFRLGYTPFVTQVENLARFYAVLCRFRKSLSRLRIFIVDAMYCMNFKAIPLIKQCVDVWMHVLPLSHMRAAKNPLLLTIVYLVFYFHSDELKDTHAVGNLKLILTKRYSYKIEDFNEKSMIEKLRECILELKGKSTEGLRVLSTAFILFTKRNGVKWCQKKIVDGMLMPLIRSKTTPEPAKAFSITLLGRLLRPYPDHMKLHCEMTVNQLLLLMEENPSVIIEEAILTSLILLRKHNKLRTISILQSWIPKRKISSELEDQVKILIQEQPLKNWIKSLCTNVYK